MAGENSSNLPIRQAEFLVTNLTKILKNRQFHQADFAFTNLTKMRRNRHIYEHSLSLKEFREICHFRYCLHFWT